MNEFRDDNTEGYTAADAVTRQHSEIACAIALLQNKLDRMADSVNPEDATWDNVSEFGKAAHVARIVIEHFDD